MRFIIVRHAETQWNEKRIIQGQLDSPITPKGYRQIEARIHSIKDIDISEIICSSSGRAYTTAKLIAEHFNCEIKKDERLQEQNFGMFQGMPYDDVFRNYPDLSERIVSGEPWLVDPQSESTLDVLERIRSCLLSIARNNSSKIICIVTHGFALQSLIWHLHGENSNDDLKKYSHYSCSYSIVDLNKDCFKLINWSISTHLIYI